MCWSRLAVAAVTSLLFRVKSPTVALRSVGLTSLLYAVAMPQRTDPAADLSTPIVSSRLEFTAASLSHHAVSFHNFLCYRYYRRRQRQLAELRVGPVFQQGVKKTATTGHQASFL